MGSARPEMDGRRVLINYPYKLRHCAKDLKTREKVPVNVDGVYEKLS